MARLALAVGYTSRTNSRSESPQLLYLGTSFQAAKEAVDNPPAGIGYTEAYRLDGLPNKRQHHALPAEPVEELKLEAPPLAKKSAKKSPGEEAPAPEAPAES